MTEKEKIVEEMIGFSLSYAKMWDFLEQGKWFKEKLMLTDISILKEYLYNMKTIERNKREPNGKN